MFYLILLTAYLVINLTIFVYALHKVRNSGKREEFIISKGLILGIFVWEDAILISIYSLLTTALAVLVQDIRWFVLAFLVYWFVRGLGETIYYLLQEFIIKKEYPHDSVLQVPFWNHLFGKISAQKFYILSQVTAELAAALSLFLIILLLKYWEVLEVVRWV